jgi:hypothetical protein
LQDITQDAQDVQEIEQKSCKMFIISCKISYLEEFSNLEQDLKIIIELILQDVDNILHDFLS